MLARYSWELQQQKNEGVRNKVRVRSRKNVEPPLAANGRETNDQTNKDQTTKSVNFGARRSRRVAKSIRLLTEELPMEIPTYVTEYLEWHAASGHQQMKIALRQAAASVNTGPDFEDASRNKRLLGAVMPNGKRLRDCLRSELEEISAWYFAIGKAARLLQEHAAEILATK